MNYPDYWKDSLKQHWEKQRLVVTEVDQASQLWSDVNKDFELTKPNGGKILRIQIIQNREVWSAYNQHLKLMTDAAKSAGKAPPLTVRLWHGTGTTDPKKI